MDDYSLIEPLVNDGVQDSVAYTVITDKLDYAPGETATITASGFKVGSTIEFEIADDPTDPGDDGEADVYQPFSVTDGGEGDLDGVANGQVVTTWFVPTDNNGTGSGTPDALNATLNLTATGSNGQVATTTFTDSQEDYKHWANLPPLSATNWQNGALQQSNSQYYEGGVVPHYFKTKLDEGTTYSFWIAYDYYINGDDDGGFKRLNTYNLTETIPFLPSGNAGTPLADNDTTFETGGKIYIKNADVLSIGSFVTQTNGNNVIRYVPVTFIVDNGDGDFTDKNIQADFYWGLQLALPGDVTPTSNGASEWSGASIRTSVNDKNPLTGAFLENTIGIGGGGDLSINPNAILPQAPSIALDKIGTWIDGDGDNFADVGETITYELKVTNDGNVTLTGVTVTDPKITVAPPSGFDGELSPGEMATFTGSYTITQPDIDAGKVDNAALATGTPPTGTNVTDPGDNTELLPQNAKIDIEKYVKVSGGTFVDADTAADSPTTLEGSQVDFKFVVTNDGNVTLSDITVTDSDFNLNGLSGDGDTATAGYQIASLAPNASANIFYTQSAATSGQHTNTGTASTRFNGSTVSDSDDANYFGECPPCEFAIFESFSGPNINVTILLEEMTGGVKFTVTETDPNLIGDLRGVFFHVDPDTGTPDPLTGLNVTGANVTEYRVKKDSIQDLGDGVNMNGDGNRHKYDVGVEIGTQGIGKDDIQSTVFIVSNSNPDFELNVENFADVEFGVRLTSVGQRGSNRNQSSKIFGFSPEDCGCEIIPGFASLPVLANAGNVI